MISRFLGCLVVAALVVSSPSFAQDRIGIAFDFFGEGSQLAGEQWINNSRIDQSDEFGSASFLSGTAYVMFQTDVKRLRWGPGVRLYGNYTGGEGNNGYTFGLLNELLVMGEYGIPAIEKFDVVLGARVGVPVLIPGGDFAREIAFQQSQGVGVWSLPRVGWLGGVNLGVRREMAKNLWLRMDLLGQVGQIYLFATDQRVDSLRIRKFWSTYTLRTGLTFTLELGL